MESDTTSTYYSRTIHYDVRNHLSVLFQTHGSVWPKIIPHCIMLAVFTAIVFALDRYTFLDLRLPEFGHQLMSTIVAFLIVSRCTIALSLYFEQRGNCSNLFRGTREVVQKTCHWTEAIQSEEARQWRSEVALYAMLLLRVTVAVLQKQAAWELPELPDVDKKRLQLAFCKDSAGNVTVEPLSQRLQRLPDAAAEPVENLRAPIRMSFKLSHLISSHSKKMGLDSRQEQQILECIKDFMQGYYGLRKYLTIPYPFPLVQMARTFLFLYIYTLPFAVISRFEKLHEAIFVVCIISYGFLGIEHVAIELHDPFGTDANDLPVETQSSCVYDDVCYVLLETDGMPAACKLWAHMDPSQYPTSNGDASSNLFAPSETSKLLP